MREDISVLQERARSALRLGHHEEAAAFYQQAVKLDPTLIDLHLRIAHCFQKAGNNKHAGESLLTAARLYAENMYGAQALSALRQYRRLVPDADRQEEPRRILQICQEQGFTLEENDMIVSRSEWVAQSLRHHPLFANASEKFERLVETLPTRDLSDGEMLCQMGEPAEHIYIVVTGKIEAWFVPESRREFLGESHPGEVCGEMAFFSGEGRTAELSSGGESVVLLATRSQAELLCTVVPDLRGYLDHLYRQHILCKQLALTPIFSALDGDAWRWIAERMEPVTLSSGKMLFSEGKGGSRSIWLIRRGIVVEYLTLQGREITLEMMRAGDLVGELAVINQAMRHSSARAITECDLLRLPGKDYLKLLGQYIVLTDTLHRRKQQKVERSRMAVRNQMHGEDDEMLSTLIIDIWSAAPRAK